MTWVHATYLAMNAFIFLELEQGAETVGEFDREAFRGPIRDNLIAAVGILLRSLPIQLQFGA
jgi:hypothetical protein